MKDLLTPHRLVREGKTLAKFLIVGGASFLIYFAAYYVFTRYLFPNTNKTLLNLTSICVSMVFNFLAHRAWTYSAKEKSVKQVARYLFVVVSAAALQSFLFWLGYEQLHIYDLIVTILVGGICAMYSFFAHRLFTFREKHPPVADRVEMPTPTENTHG